MLKKTFDSHGILPGAGGAVAGKGRSLAVISALLVVLTLAVYLRVIEHEFVLFDDDVYVTGNAHVATGLSVANLSWAFTTLHAATWHPITWLSHQLDVQLFGMSSHCHHLTSVFIHTVSTALFLFLLFRLTGALWQSSFAAAVFALHPLHVESVAWIAERKDVLCGFFWILTLLLYTEFALRNKRCCYFLALFSFILGIMAKPMIVTLPLVMLLVDFWPLERYKPDEPSMVAPRFSGVLSPSSALFLEKIPFLVCSLISATVTIYSQHRGGTINSLETLPMTLRIANSVIAYAKYVILTFWPRDLAVLYPVPSSFPLWQFITALLLLILVTAAAMTVRHRHPYLLVGWLWFIITLLPVIGLVQVGSQSMADRYTYMPQTGLLLMACWGVPSLFGTLAFRRLLIVPLASLAVVAMVFLTWRQLGYWRDSISLFQRTLAVTSGNAHILNNLGVALTNKGDLDGAIREYRSALAITPNYAKAHNNLGVALIRRGDLRSAIREFKCALFIEPDNHFAQVNLEDALRANAYQRYRK